MIPTNESDWKARCTPKGPTTWGEEAATIEDEDAKSKAIQNEHGVVAEQIADAVGCDIRQNTVPSQTRDPIGKTKVQ